MATSTAQSNANISQLLSQGYTQEQLGGFDYGKNLSSGEVQRFLSQTGPSPLQTQRNNALTAINNAANMTYNFDPNQFLPGIQQQADSIYNPQQAQLEAIRQLQSSQYQDQAITTAKEFDKQLQSEIESINNRGAFFSGGAVEREGEIGDAKLRALNQLGLQATAADFSNLAQQGLLAAEEAQFIQDRLYNAESSAYARWTDQRNFSFQSALQQYQIYTDERNFARDVFESDRNYNLQVEELDMRRKEFEQNYSITKEQFEMAKEQFGIDIQTSQLQLDKALKSFKESYAVTNSGVLGVDENGKDILDSYRSSWESSNGTSNTSSGYVGPYSSEYYNGNDGGVFDIDNYLK